MLRFCSAGIPLSTSVRTTFNGVKRVKELGLDGMELEFVHSASVNPQDAERTKNFAKANGLLLSCHGSYYINLISDEKAKAGASRSRIIQAARALDSCGGKKVVFHAGFYQGKSHEEALALMVEQLKRVRSELKEKGLGRMVLCPEVTGKKTQFGSLEALFELHDAVDGVSFCIDFSHLHARENGCLKTKKDFDDILSRFKKEDLRDLHMHFSGIEFTEKGERRHLPLSSLSPDYRLFLRSLKDFKVSGAVVCESPLIEEDALLMKRFYSSL